MKLSSSKALTVLGLLSFCVVSSFSSLHAAQLPAGQDVGARIRTEREEKERDAVAEKLEKPSEAKIEGKDEVTADKKAAPAAAAPSAKVVIRSIEVEGNTLLSNDELRPTVMKYAGRELSIADFQALAADITAEYHARGYLTSFAFVPPQKVEEGKLVIAVREGKVGEVRVSGNKYFGTDYLLRHIEAKKGDFFNYEALRQNIRRINEQPDVKSQVVLARGKEEGETDIDLKVQDRFPWHVSAAYNNYNSHFLERNKYSVELKNNNLFGMGDIFSTEVQLGEADRYQMYAARYLLPLTSKLKTGFYYIHVDQKLGRSLGDQKITGDGDVANVYMSYKLIDSQDISISVSPAFEYKDFTNHADGVLIGEENIRIAKLGFDADFNDPFGGRNLVTQEIDRGIPDVFGGMDNRSMGSTRPGAAGDFLRFTTNMARVQKLPYSTVLLLKGAMQHTSNHMPAAEQYQIGGYYTVRGYPVSEYSGDQGYNANVELHVPPYFVDKSFKLPYSSKSFYDQFTFLWFFDWGYVSNHSPLAGEPKDRQIYSTGLGLRWNSDNMSVSFDYGFPLGPKASDGMDSAGYVETKLFF